MKNVRDSAATTPARNTVMEFMSLFPRSTNSPTTSAKTPDSKAVTRAPKRIGGDLSMAIRGGQAYKVAMAYVRPILISAALTAGAACSQPDSPEQQVQTTIEQMELAAEQRNIGDLMEYVSNEYRDADGHGPKEISQYVRGYMVANQSIQLLTRIDEIEFPGDDEARAKVLVGMVGREADAAGAWDLAADLYEFDIALIREDGDWKVTYAKWIRR